MKTIWKFILKDVDQQEVLMPIGVEILTVQEQKGFPCIWAVVDDSAEQEYRCFQIFGTGHPIYTELGIARKYIGTYQLNNGSLVFHLFEVIE